MHLEFNITCVYRGGGLQSVTDKVSGISQDQDFHAGTGFPLSAAKNLPEPVDTVFYSIFFFLSYYVDKVAINFPHTMFEGNKLTEEM